MESCSVKKINHLRTLNYCRNNNCFSGSTNIPGWATDYIKRIEKVQVIKRYKLLRHKNKK